MSINLSDPIVLKPAVKEVISSKIKIGLVEIKDDKTTEVTVVDSVTSVIVKKHKITLSDATYNQIVSIVEAELLSSGAVSGTIE